jgi:hypothetical protein
VDEGARAVDQALDCGGRPVAGRGGRPGADDPRERAAREWERLMAGGVGAREQAAQAADLKAVVDGGLADAEFEQLLTCHHPVLPACERRDRLIVADSPGTNVK